MWRHRSDIPLGEDHANRFLPWLIALMVYLAGLAVAGTVALDRAVDRWSSGLGGSLTVQVAPAVEAEDPVAETNARVARAIALIEGSPGVVRVEELATERLAKLLEPWLGSGELMGELPLPRLIDVELAPGPGFDTEALGDRLETEVPGASLDDHGAWLDDLKALARSIEGVALAILVLIAVAGVAAVVFVTRTGLAVHHEIVEVLHFVGAKDAYVAKQFQSHALILSLKGGLVGTVLAVISILMLDYLGARVEVTLLPKLTLGPWGWVGIAAVPLAAAAIATLTARITVTRSLARMV